MDGREMLRSQATPRRSSSEAAGRGWVRPALLVAGAYAVTGVAWVMLSDWLVGALVPSEHAAFWQAAKGTGFIAVTGAALYFVIGRILDERQRGAIAQANLATEVRSRAREQRRLAHRLMQAEEETRRAVAKDLHDGPLQALTLTFMQLDHAARAVEQGEPVAAERVTGAMAAIREASEDIRAVVRALHPPLLAELGLAAAVERHCHETAQRAHRDVLYSGQERLPELGGQSSIAVFRILQEALANALKHTQDGPIEVDLRAEGTHVHLHVADAGPGFNVDAAGRLGLGLVSMRERAESVGGLFSLESGSGGTRISVRIPIDGALDA